MKKTHNMAQPQWNVVTPTDDEKQSMFIDFVEQWLNEHNAPDEHWMSEWWVCFEYDDSNPTIGTLVHSLICDDETGIVKKHIETYQHHPDILITIDDGDFVARLW